MILNDFEKQHLLRESSSRGQFLSFAEDFYFKDFSLDNMLCLLLLPPGGTKEVAFSFTDDIYCDSALIVTL